MMTMTLAPSLNSLRARAAAAQSADQIGDGQPAEPELDFGIEITELDHQARDDADRSSAAPAAPDGDGGGGGGGDGAGAGPQVLPPPPGPQPKPETNSNGGGADPRPLPPPPKGEDDYGANADEVAQKLAELNERHALVLVSNKVAVLREAISSEGEPTFTLMQPAAFHQWLANSFVTINENAVPISKL